MLSKMLDILQSEIMSSSSSEEGENSPEKDLATGDDPGSSSVLGKRKKRMFDMKVMKKAMDEITKDLQMRIPDNKLSIVLSKFKDHATTDIVKYAYQVGEKLPDFVNLSSTTNNNDNSKLYYSSEELRSKGPLIITFFRGDWCPWCHRSVNILSDYVTTFIDELGASAVVAISPQTKAAVTSMEQRQQEDNNVQESFSSGLTILSDPNCDYAQDCNIAYCLDDDFFQELNSMVPKYNRNNDGGDDGPCWYLPVPATYVVDTNGIILYRFLDTEIWKRAEPTVIMQILKQEQKKSMKTKKVGTQQQRRLRHQVITRTSSSSSYGSKDSFSSDGGSSIDTPPKMPIHTSDKSDYPLPTEKQLPLKRSHPEQGESPRRSPGLYSIKHNTWIKHKSSGSKKCGDRSSTRRSRRSVVDISEHAFQLDDESSSASSSSASKSSSTKKSSSPSTKRKGTGGTKNPRSLLQRQTSLPPILEDESSSSHEEEEDLNASRSSSFSNRTH